MSCGWIKKNLLYLLHALLLYYYCYYLSSILCKSILYILLIHLIFLKLNKLLTAFFSFHMVYIHHHFENDFNVNVYLFSSVEVSVEQFEPFIFWQCCLYSVNFFGSEKLWLLYAILVEQRNERIISFFPNLLPLKVLEGRPSKRKTFLFYNS